MHKVLLKHQIIEQFSRFIVVGLISTALNYSVFFILYQHIALHYLISSSSGFICGTVIGYKLNKKWTFQVTEKSKSQLTKYFIVYLSSLTLSLLFLELAVTKFSLSPLLANFFALILTTLTNFCGTKLIVFK